MLLWNVVQLFSHSDYTNGIEWCGQSSYCHEHAEKNNEPSDNHKTNLQAVLDRRQQRRAPKGCDDEYEPNDNGEEPGVLVDERLVGSDCCAELVVGTLVELFRSTVNNWISGAKGDAYTSLTAAKIVKNIVSIHKPSQRSLFMSHHGHKVAFVVDKFSFFVDYLSIRIVHPILYVFDLVCRRIRESFLLGVLEYKVIYPNR